MIEIVMLLVIFIFIFYKYDRNKLEKFFNKKEYKYLFISLGLVMLFNVSVNIGESIGRFIYYILN